MLKPRKTSTFNPSTTVTPTFWRATLSETKCARDAAAGAFLSYFPTRNRMVNRSHYVLDIAQSTSSARNWQIRHLTSKPVQNSWRVMASSRSHHMRTSVASHGSHCTARPPSAALHPRTATARRHMRTCCCADLIRNVAMRRCPLNAMPRCRRSASEPATKCPIEERIEGASRAPEDDREHLLQVRLRAPADGGHERRRDR